MHPWRRPVLVLPDVLMITQALLTTPGFVDKEKLKRWAATKRSKLAGQYGVIDALEEIQKCNKHANSTSKTDRSYRLSFRAVCDGDNIEQSKQNLGLPLH